MARRATRGNPVTRYYKVDGGSSIAAGDMVMLNSAGYALTAAALASAKPVVGVAVYAADNTSGSDGDISVCVEHKADFLVAATTVAIASLNGVVYAEGAATVDETQGANEVIAGMLVEVVSASSAWVYIDADLNETMRVAIAGANP